MIVVFGPAGAGKSVQGQILAARHGWRWLSAGQLLRDSRDPEIIQQMHEGVLIEVDKINKVMGDALNKAQGISRVVLDGFPRQIDQAQWLLENQPQHGRPIELAIVLEVPRPELQRRLELRGRLDDTKNVIEERLGIYRKEIYPILAYLTEQKVKIAHIDGTGTVGQVHDRIEEELKACSLV